MPTKTGAFLILIWFCLLPPSSSAQEPPDDATTQKQTTYQLQSSVLSAAGRHNASDNHRQVGSLGQLAVGGCQATTKLQAGFWSILQGYLIVADTPVPAFLVDRLLPNYPNPFNPATHIAFSLSETKPIVIEVFDLRGERVRVLLREVRSAGLHHVVWDGRNDVGHRVASGTYFYRLEAGGYRSAQKMLLVK